MNKIKTMTIGGVTYDVSDETAREELAQLGLELSEISDFMPKKTSATTELTLLMAQGGMYMYVGEEVDDLSVIFINGVEKDAPYTYSEGQKIYGNPGLVEMGEDNGLDFVLAFSEGIWMLVGEFGDSPTLEFATIKITNQIPMEYVDGLEILPRKVYSYGELLNFAEMEDSSFGLTDAMCKSLPIQIKETGISFLLDGVSYEGNFVIENSMYLVFGNRTIFHALYNRDESLIDENLGDFCIFRAGDSAYFISIAEHETIAFRQYEWTHKFTNELLDITLPIEYDEQTNAYSIEGSLQHGEYVKAEGRNSHAEGWKTLASGSESHAEGYETIAKGSHSHAECWATLAKGNYSHAEGYSTIAAGSHSHAEGENVVARGDSSHAGGGNYPHSMFIVDIIGNINDNYYTVTRARSHYEVEGEYHNDEIELDVFFDILIKYGKTFTLSNSELPDRKVIDVDKAERKLIITTPITHNTSSNHVWIHLNIAKGNNSFVHGDQVVALNNSETAFGRVNKSYESKDDIEATLFTIGNGNDVFNPSNALELKKSGDLYLKGVGGFDGTNSESSLSIAAILNKLVQKVGGID